MQWTPAARALLAAAVVLLGTGPACDTVDLHSFPVLLEPKDPPMACAAFCMPGSLLLAVVMQQECHVCRGGATAKYQHHSKHILLVLEDVLLPLFVVAHLLD